MCIGIDLIHSYLCSAGQHGIVLTRNDGPHERYNVVGSLAGR